ncbi:hypothetical protein CHELA1G11_13556 [Hyphomicrobiales bacterium]|nr:hypothetical protein CHELA1G2_10760 [Hyphomicrobiales bacterium]CAH1672501.1 hypothetical protein CHELA1G11_13556 [Hyphomicrobiales bacterium]
METRTSRKTLFVFRDQAEGRRGAACGVGNTEIIQIHYVIFYFYVLVYVNYESLSLRLGRDGFRCDGEKGIWQAFVWPFNQLRGCRGEARHRAEGWRGSVSGVWSGGGLFMAPRDRVKDD